LGLNEELFLSADIQQWVEKHHRESPDAFRIAEDLNRAGVKTLHASEPKTDNNQQLAAALLFARIISHYQCVLILAERGVAVSAKAVVRVLLEAVFTLGACVNDSAFLDIYEKDDRRRHADLIEALLSFRGEEIGISGEEFERLRQQAVALRSGIKADKSPKIGAFDTAQRAGLLTFYRLFYVPYCNTVHTSIRDLAPHVREDSQGG
jgi:hypothetical protein